MNHRAMMTMSFYKLASEEEEAILRDMKQRLERFKGENAPKGLPHMSGNLDETDPVYPTLRTEPKDRGWGGSRMITGSGSGPTL